MVDEIPQLELGGLGARNVSRIIETRKESLRTERYARTALQWASLTPGLLLDRFPKAKTAHGRDEIGDGGNGSNVLRQYRASESEQGSTLEARGCERRTVSVPVR